MKHKYFYVAILMIAALVMSQLAFTTQAASQSTTPAGANANWWDKFGQPRYGGTLIMRSMLGNVGFDPADWQGGNRGYWETLFFRDWKADPSIEPLTTEFVSEQYYGGGLAESWEWTNPRTITVRIRRGVKWQDKAPMNGRELTANDVQYTYDRIMGAGSGFTKPVPFFTGSVSGIDRVVTTDKYTVQFKMKKPNAFGIYDVFDGGFFAIAIIAPELVQQGKLKDWKSAVGTGPWILTDYVDGSSMTYIKNPNYWGYDERYPQNKLPYLDGIKEIQIPDKATAIAALRTGRIDILEAMNFINWQEAKLLANTDPGIQQALWPTPGYGLEMRVDRKPFTDIRVRKAMQTALNRQAIAKTHYGGIVSGDPAGLIYPGFKGYTLPYSQWPKKLQEEYTYNPDKASALLKEAGYPNGFKTHILCNTTQNVELLKIVKANLMDIGIDLEIRASPDMPSVQNIAMAGKHEQMIYTATTGMPRLPAQAIVRRTSSMDKENYTMCKDPKYDNIVMKALSASTIEKAKQYCTEADMYALSQHWEVNILPSASPVLWQSWVKGNSGEQLVSGQYFFIARWWKDQQAKD